MREVTLGPLNLRTSCLGFGCASLGSRVSASDGLRALAAAYDGGVRWYDVAPAYGAGEAEVILGRFLKGRREHVQICTKVGLVPPPQGRVQRMARGLLRPVVGVARPLRAAIRRSGATANRGVALTPDLLRTSLETSLRRLGTDHVEVYALHDPAPEDLAREDILRTLEDIQSSGKARHIGVAGGQGAVQAALGQIAGGQALFDLIQMGQPDARQDARDIEAAGMGCVTHTVFGVAGQLAALSARLRQDVDVQARLAKAGFDGAPEAAAANLLLARAFALNPDGVVLASMFSQRSLAGNLAGAVAPLNPAAYALYEEIMG